MGPANRRLIRTLVVDDEPLARSNLTVLLRRDGDIQIVGECGSAAEAAVQIREKQPELVFLDVQMPEGDGFDVLDLPGGELPPAIVFVTAYDQYALKAFEAGALDYLLKPFDDRRFEKALARAKEKIAQGRAGPRRREWMAVRSAGQVAFVKHAEIDWIEAADYYACLHTGAKTHLLRRTLAELDQDLDPRLFCRIHRSSIVNLERVRALELNDDSDYRVVLENGTKLRLSRRYRKELQSRLGARAGSPRLAE
jgi:two-component system, LytTR family, response regulator